MAKQQRTKKTSVAKRKASVKRATRSRQPKSRLKKMQTLRLGFLSRRPHRSFRLTRRRDYKRSLKLPGYITFTRDVLVHLRLHKKTFLGLVAVYAVASVVLVGLASQDLFAQLSVTLRETGANLFEGAWGELSIAGILLLSSVSGVFSTQFTEGQQIFSVLLFLMVWLATVWLVRAQLAGTNPKLRDALYSSASPLVAMTAVVGLILIQLIPGALGVIAYSAAMATNLMSSGAIAMAVSIGSLLLIILSVYLTTSSFFALIVASLPGMYPWRALRIAGDLVTGRRLRILLRLLWAALIIVLLWVLVMIPIIALSTWLQNSMSQISWMPIIPFILVLVSSATIIFFSTYVYMLYRKVVDDDSASA